MRFGFITIFSPWHLLLTKGFHFFKKNCHEHKIIPEVENTILADIQYMNKYKNNLDQMKPHHFFPVKHAHEKKEFHFLKMMFFF